LRFASCFGGVKFEIYEQRKDRAKAKQATQANEILNYGSMKFHSDAPQAASRKIRF